MIDSDLQTLFNHVVQHTIDPPRAPGLACRRRRHRRRTYRRRRPFDYAALKAAYRNAAGGTGAWMVNNGFDKAHAERRWPRRGTPVAFGRPFIANPTGRAPEGQRPVQRR
jgi:N-ethylmaleimide reductase